MPALTERFQTTRWSPMRHTIHDMEKGATIILPASDYNAAKTNVDRLNDAYDGERVWKMTTKERASTITRTK